jgi:hypothetical protein
MRAIRIAVSDPPTPDVVHRFRNFGEDIYRALREECSVSIDEIDAATTSFMVRDIHKRDVGRITKLIKEELRRHHFEASATLTIGNSAV